MSVESPITQDQHWFAGEDRVFEFTVVNASNVAQNITGWALEFVLRASVDSTTALLTKTVGAGITITDGANGVCQVTIADTDTMNDTTHAPIFAAGVYSYTLRRTDANSESVLAYGDAVLQLSAAR